MTFLDTGILVGAVLKSHPEHNICLAALEDSERPFTNAHAFGESFAMLTGFYKVPVDVASELILSLRDLIPAEALTFGDYETAIREARARGVMVVEFMIPSMRHLPDARTPYGSSRAIHRTFSTSRRTLKS